MYFDYSASTPISKKALEAYVNSASKYFCNHQSKHDLGKLTQKQINKDTNNIKELLGLEKHHLNFTQNATAANKAVLEHIIHTPSTMHIICGPFEHGSVVRVLGSLQQKGLEVDVLKTDEFGQIDINSMKDLIKDNTALIITSLVDSELGIIQDVNKIKQIAKDIPLLVDITQAIGKTKLDLKTIDFLTFSAHKFYGPKGIGGILSLNKINQHFGTLSPELIHSTNIALEDTLSIDSSKVLSMHQYLTKEFKKIKQININNPKQSINHLINISIDTKENIDLVKYFSKRNIFISKGTACQKENHSPSVFRLTNSTKRATSSIRISLSHLTNNKEIKALLQTIKEVSQL